MYLLFLHSCCSAFFFTSPPTTSIYTLSLHDALPISTLQNVFGGISSSKSIPQYFTTSAILATCFLHVFHVPTPMRRTRSEEHTSELQSPMYLVCRLLLEKKKNTKTNEPPIRPK